MAWLFSLSLSFLLKIFLILKILVQEGLWLTSFSLSSLPRSDLFRSFVDYCLLKIPQDRPSSGELLRVSGFPPVIFLAVTSLPVSVSHEDESLPSTHGSLIRKHIYTVFFKHRNQASYWDFFFILFPPLPHSQGIRHRKTIELHFIWCNKMSRRTKKINLCWT